MMVEINIGKNNNFKCSQVLSFTALKAPTNKLPLDHSKEKCNNVPKRETKIILKIINLISFS